MKLYRSASGIGLTVLVAALAACGGGGGSTSVSTGVLVDSSVAGIGYKTATQSGITNAKGEYFFLPGETVTFFIGNIQFPPVVAKGTVTPLDIAQTTDINNQVVSNILVLLQSLDEDGNPSNGITIPSVAASKATSAVSFDVSPLAFSANTTVIGLVANSGSVTKSLVSQSSALSNFQSTLTGLSIPFTSTPVSKQAASIVTPEPASGNCAQGGSKIQSGIDTNANNVLDANEVTNTSFVCNGATGATGQNALTNVSSEAAGSNCAAGGSRIQVGVDRNGDNVLDSTEVTSNSFVCNGAIGATGPAGLTGSTGASGFNSLVKVTPELAGANCASGGNKIQAGLDTNRDGFLGTDEVTSTQYTCNGTFSTSYDITPPTIISTAPLVATGLNTTFDTTYTDDTELAFARKSDGTVLWFAGGTKTQKLTDRAQLALGNSLTRSYVAVDMAGNVAKKTITMTTPVTAMQFGVYKPVNTYSLPTGFDCSYTSDYPYGIGAKDGAVLSSASLQDGHANAYPPGGSGGTSTPTVLDGSSMTYTGWTTLNGYAPMISANFSGDQYGVNQFGGQALTLVPLSATAFSFESSGGGTTSPSGSGSFSIVTGYTGTVTVTKTTPMTVNVNVSMKCNINNAGFVTGTPASFDIQYVTEPIAIAGNSQTAIAGNVVVLSGSAASNASTPIKYSWTLTSKPTGSQTVLTSATTTNPTFTPDIAGIYVAQLVVNDGQASSAPATVAVTAHDYTNVTNFTKLSGTVVAAVNLMNSQLLATPTYLDDLLAKNTVTYDVPVQNYFGSDTTNDVAKAQFTVTTIKADFPVQATADMKPYRLVYEEFDGDGALVHTLRIGSIYGCSNSNDVNNPMAECVQYSYEVMSNNTVQFSLSGSVSLVKTIVNGLTYLSSLL